MSRAASIHVAFLALALGLGSGAGSARAEDAVGGSPPVGVDVGTPRVITFLDYFESGRRAVDAFVAARDSASMGRRLADTIRAKQRACVRLEIRLGRGAVRQSMIGSGVLIDGGRRVLTAGHSFRGIDPVEIVVTLPGGGTRQAQLSRQVCQSGASSHDWALLDLIGDPASDWATTEGGVPSEGELVFVLGYPDQIGVDANGRLAYASRSGGDYREPLVTLAVVRGTRPLTLLPRVGAIPTVGMSGGPVFDLGGRLIGIFASVSRVEGENGVTYTYGVSPLGPVLASVSTH